MQSPLKLTFRHMDPSPALEQRIRQRVDDLHKFCGDIVSCHVVVETRHRHHEQGNLFEVRVDLVVPGREIVVGRERGLNHAHENAHVAVRDAFDAARRQLEDHARSRRGEVKVHSVPDHGQVARLLWDRDCGFIAAADGQEIYFHRNSVAEGAFDQLTVGTEVRFVAQHSESAEGLPASTVVPFAKRHLPPVDTVRS